MPSKNTQKTKIAQENAPSLLKSSSLESTQEQQAEESVQEQDFEDLLEKAKLVLNKLNTQEITLKESLALYERGMQSLKSAEEILEQAKLRYQEFKD
ncbi:MAG: exodeoxyribonuclease VII small subunit [Helicobacter sp.]|uniref:exodeoxyribonuclease VII small subunit n=1 Tax=Helicobacter sp. TaxID=218 RepID=UPI0025BD117F|nr:exodeoxyribonuclease VII small subunit [Helicobacter sp.]MCH5313329.1 exodeoxyribonuclease VII small subunit [Helicobacter sp.]